MSLFSELRRRQVFRAAAWYGGLAWLAIEVADTVFPQFGLPSQAVRAVIIVALLGLPVALLLAWMFDLGATGLRREQPADPQAAASAPAALWRTPSVWLALALGAGLALSAQQAWRKLVSPALQERPGLAVLPFANLSPDPDNAYFADGLHEEILAAVGRTETLRVISRTSVEEYRDRRQNLRDVARALGVTHILEGSVRREGNAVRVTLQLIDGRTDEHLWAETYDGELEGVLELQRKVALQVASELGARLSPIERRDIEQAGTSDPEAYELYLQAVALRNTARDDSQLRNAERLLGQAIARDPGFARAYALRARLLIDLDGSASGGPGDRERARADIDRALELQPELPDALVARAFYTVYIVLDPVRALDDLSRAVSAAPNDPRTREAMGLALRRLGRVDEALEQFELAAALSPAEIAHQWKPWATLYYAKRYTDAKSALQPLLDRWPAESSLQVLPFLVRFMATGETAGWRDQWERLAPTMAPLDRGITGQDMFVATGDLAGLIAYYQHAPVEALPDARDYTLGVAFSALGDTVRAEPHLRAAAAAAAASKDARDRRDHSWTDATALAEAAVALELLGERSVALRAADEGVRLAPEARDALNGPRLALKRAWVLIRSGTRAEEGYAELARLMGALDVHPRYVAVEPLWLMLRADARVQQILRDAVARP